MPEYVGMPMTETQFEAVTASGRNMLVSAAAGSGKTRVLAARAVYLVADATPPSEFADLLVVTFTRKAAAEMRGRIGEVFAKRIERADDAERPRLQRQQLLLGRAQIGTIHSFCQALLRRHFQALRIDPNFTVIEDDAAGMLRRRVASDVIDRHFVDDRDRFYQFVDAYGNATDTGVRSVILRLHGLLTSMPDPRRWRSDALDRLDGNAFIDAIAAQVAATLALVRDQAFAFAERFRVLDHAGELPAKFADYVNDFAERMAFFHDIADAGQLDELRRQHADWLAGDKIPTMSTAHPHRALRDAFGEVRSMVRDKGEELAKLLRFSTADWQDSLRRIRPYADLLFELLDDFQQAYGREKQFLRTLDFADLEGEALRLLRENPNLAEQERGRLRHVLVDEAQDLNPLQDELLRTLAPPGGAFFVGDAKQSIYRFRLADVDVFMQRETDYANADTGRLVRLAENFRSRGSLIDSINSVFDILMRGGATEIDYGKGHALTAAADFPDTAPAMPIEVHVLPRDVEVAQDDDDDNDDAGIEAAEREAIFMARRLRTMLGTERVTENGQLVPLRPGHCAVLLRAAKHHADVIARVLRRFDIPVQADVTTGFFDALEIRDVLSVLETIENSRQDVSLAASMRSPMLGLQDAEALMADIRLAAPATGHLSFHEAFHAVVNGNTELGARLRGEVTAPLVRWRSLFERLPVGDALWTLLTEQTNYLAWARALDDGAQREANVLELVDRARRHDAQHGDGLGPFLRVLATLRSEAELGQPDDAAPAGDVVRVMSVHASKGLEFPVVFLPQMGSRFNERDAAAAVAFDRDAGLALRTVDLERKAQWPSAASVVVREALRRRGRAEQLRVLYVALTRAQERVIAVGSEKNPEKPATLQKDPSKHTNPLTWLRLAAAGGATVALREYGKDDTDAWHDEAADRTDESRLGAVSAWNSVDGEPTNAAVSRVERILTRPKAMDLPQATSVTGLAKVQRNRLVGLQPEQDEPAAPFSLRPPLFVDGAATAGEVGSATHVLLDQLDYRHAGAASDVRRQAQALVARGHLPEILLGRLDYEAVAWMASGPVGEAVRAADDVRRELPFMQMLPSAHLPPRAGETLQPADHPLLRGRLDLAIAHTGQWTLIDFKTDRQVPDTLETYDTQLMLYAEMLQALTAMPVARRWLVFLTPRRMITL